MGTHFEGLGLLQEATRNAAVDLPQMLRRTIEAACYIADVDSAIIALINNQDGTLRIRARGTEDGSVLVSEDAHHLPYLVAGLQKGIPFVLSPAEETVARPTLVIPLFAQGEALGVMAISSQGDPFTPSEQTMLTGLSTYLAAAVASAAQIERTRTTSRELSMLIEASNAIASSLDLGSVLQTTARHLMRATQAHWCIIADWDRENNRLLTLGEHRDAYWPVAAGRVIDLTASPIREKAVHGGKVYNFSIRDEGLNGQQRMLLEALGVQRVLGLPIQHEGRLVGLVELANIHAHMPYSHSQRNRSIRQVLDLATYLLTHQPSDGSDYLRQAAHNLVAEAAADWATLYYWDRDSDTLVRLLEYGSGIWAGEVTAPVYDLDAFASLRVVLHENRIGEVRSDQSTAAERTLLAERHLGAMLALPLVYKSDAVGVMMLFSTDAARRFEEGELRIANALARQASAALENARLVSDLQQSLDQLKAMQAQLIRAARMSVLGDLSAMLAHQISNPLTIILGDAEMLIEDLEEGPERDSAQAILRAGMRAQQVVERVLRAARHEEREIPMAVEDTIQNTLDLISPQIRRRGITLGVTLAPELPVVKAVPGHLEDIWSNLLINARDAVLDSGHRPGRVDIEANPTSDQSGVIVAVSDNGTGIPPDKLTDIFTPLFTTKPSGQGTGLGLYIVKQIVDGMGGRIEIDSHVGQGTRVSVILPATPIKEE